MRVLVTGYSGMLGRKVVERYTSILNNQVFGAGRTPATETNITSVKLDLTSLDEIPKLLEEINPELIIQTAALVNVDACEENKEYAYSLHVESTKEIVKYNPETRFIYISTDSVFDGKKGDYKEEDKSSPLNAYAQTKLKGETEALRGKNSLVLRTNIYGTHLNTAHSKPASSLAEWALEELKKGNKIKGFTDLIFNPLYTGQLAKLTEELAKTNIRGLLHLGSYPAISKYDFLVKLSKQFGYDSSLIEEARYREISKQNVTKAPRPENTTLNTDKYQELMHAPPPSLEQGLKDLWTDYKFEAEGTDENR